jgi:4-amino-4-deoxy-L-arabinose transferase-like glycosyltransferase
MATTTVRQTDPTLRPAIRLALLFAAIKLAIHIASTLWQRHHGYGYFRDEFYYILCGRHLAAGYVDHGPIVALQARFAETFFGHSLLGIRFLSFLAGAARVFLTGLLCWALGGKRSAQGLAMLCCLCVSIYFGLDSFLSMNSFESLFWMTCALALLMVQRGSDPAKWWRIFGLAAGLGLLNKPSMTFFLLALLVALLCTPQRRLLFTRHAAIGIAILLALASINLQWQILHHWPTLEFLHNGRVANKNVHLGPLAFLGQQVRVLNPLNALVWVAGLVHLLKRSSERYLGLTYLFFLALTMALGAKDYYVAPVYPILFAAGGIAWTSRFAESLSVRKDRILAFPILTTLILIGTILLFPLSNPVLRPETFVAYQKALHIPQQNSENDSSGVLPQFFADRFGWQEEADAVSRVVANLSPGERSRAVVLTRNYGEAASLLFLAPNLGVPVISGHNNFFLWGPQGATGEVVIALSMAKPSEFTPVYDQVEIVGRMDHPLSMPFERRSIYLLHHRKKDLASEWPEFKFYF